METIRFNNGIYTIDLENGTYFCRISRNNNDNNDNNVIWSEEGGVYHFPKSFIFTIKSYSKEDCRLYIEACGKRFGIGQRFLNLIGV